MRKLFAVVFAAGAVAFGLLSGKLLRRYEVEGRSMLRTYSPGERLLIERVSYRFRPPLVGEAVVVRHPGANGRLDLKRIAAGPGAEVTVRGQTDFLGMDEWYVLGDNLDESTDSRELGPLRTSDIVGRVWLKY